ncbi:unnamed protein product [Haemonchus placei]|uniref:Secreted protein n=1 Tax=Haemonchus placei TaxID=6290 RepID=A0A0N4W6M3_HAEPC|nr:unnamed protein product [Haemonchus placei]
MDSLILVCWSIYLLFLEGVSTHTCIWRGFTEKTILSSRPRMGEHLQNPTELRRLQDQYDFPSSS